MQEPPDHDSELADWIARLKQGDVEFYTRFQEEEWGCFYIGEVGFMLWSRNPFDRQRKDEIVQEDRILRVFARYPVEKLWALLTEKRIGRTWPGSTSEG